MREGRSPAWSVVVPVKGGAGAKSRLTPPPGIQRADLALAMAADVVAAATQVVGARRVIVVTSCARTREALSPAGVRIIPDPGGGLDAAVGAGINAARDVAARDGVAVLQGDLPAVTPDALRQAFAAARMVLRGLVPDVEGSGTALLTIGPEVTGTGIMTAFGAGSASRHRDLGFELITVHLPGLRCDVDDEASLRRALDLGVGRHTRAVLSATKGPATSSMTGPS